MRPGCGNPRPAHWMTAPGPPDWHAGRGINGFRGLRRSFRAIVAQSRAGRRFCHRLWCRRVRRAKAGLHWERCGGGRRTPAFAPVADVKGAGRQNPGREMSHFRGLQPKFPGGLRQPGRHAVCCQRSRWTRRRARWGDRLRTRCGVWRQVDGRSPRDAAPACAVFRRLLIGSKGRDEVGGRGPGVRRPFRNPGRGINLFRGLRRNFRAVVTVAKDADGVRRGRRALNLAMLQSKFGSAEQRHA